jgi:hypothetical protein
MAFGVSLVCNLALAVAAGGLHTSRRLFRNEMSLLYAFQLRAMSRRGILLRYSQKYLELFYDIVVYDLVHTPHIGKSEILRVRQNLDFIIDEWEAKHIPYCVHESATAPGKVYVYARSLQNILAGSPIVTSTLPTANGTTHTEPSTRSEAPIQESKEEAITRLLDSMSLAMRDVNRDPLMWAIPESLILGPLLRQVQFLPHMETRDGTFLASEDFAYGLGFPDFTLVLPCEEKRDYIMI